MKKSKTVDPSSPEEIAKEMSVGFGLDKYWYVSTPFPQLHAILKNQNWETLISEFCCNPINLTFCVSLFQIFQLKMWFVEVFLRRLKLSLIP